MSVYIKKGDYVRVILEGAVSDSHVTGDFKLGMNLIERDSETFRSVEHIDPPLRVGDILSGPMMTKIDRRGVVLEAVASGIIWIRNGVSSWAGSNGSVVEDRVFRDARTYRVVYVP